MKKNKFYVITLIVFASCSTGLAQEDADPVMISDKRDSRVSALITAGRDRYRDYMWNGELGLDETWLLQARVSAEKSERVTTASGFLLGFDRRFESEDQETLTDFNFGIIGKREPDDVIGRGATLGVVRAFVTPGWRGRVTEFSIQGTVLRYRQLAGRNNRISKSYVAQNSLFLDFKQELNKKIALGVSVTRFNVGGDSPENLSRAISTRPNTNNGLVTVVDGIPRQNTALRGEFGVSDFTLLTLEFFQTNYASENFNRGVMLAGDFTVNSDWSLTGAASTTRDSQGQRGGGVLQLGAGYTF